MEMSGYEYKEVVQGNSLVVCHECSGGHVNLYTHTLMQMISGFKKW
jgi:hypothetical protein